MEKEVPPSSEQIKRLKALQGVDCGVFTLSVFSTLEGHMRHLLNGSISNQTTFPDLVNLYKSRYSVGNPKEYQLIRNIITNERNTNSVRHRFENLSVEEAKAAIYLLSEFANIFKLPNKDQLAKLSTSLVNWDNRKSPQETALELEKANRELKRLALENSDMTAKVDELESKQKELSSLNTKLKALQEDYDEQITNNRKNKEKIDELRRLKNEAEMENRKAQETIQEQISKLSDAQSYIDNLARMTSYTRTRYDYEQSLLRLTREQESIVNQVKFEHDFLVKGSAGTGKSLVLLKTLEKLIQKKDGTSFKLITFSRSLEKYNKYVAQLMNIENPIEEELITTSENYTGKIIADAFPGKEFSYDLFRCLENEEVVSGNPLGKEIWTELDKFILPKCISKKEYCDEKINRTGMKKLPNGTDRNKIWAAVEAIFAEWDKMDKISVQYANYKVVSEIDKGEYTIPANLKTDYLFVDEVQDLTVTTLRLLKYSVNKNLILAGDNDQSVYQPGFAWTKAGIDVVGNSRALNVNFRSTIQIQEVAEKYRQLMKGFDKKNRPETFRIGAPVELHEEENQAEAFESMLDSVNMCIQSLGYEPENICLIAGKRDYLSALQGLLKEKLDLESDFVNSEDFSFAKKGVVRLATPQSCKGLDFPVVLYYLDHRAHFLNVYDEETADKMNRNMIYTAITRGIELLHIFMLKDSNSGPVDDLRKIIK
ncbi:UvrD/REP helicase N-terminal domain-containing protein [Treponema bryantii]|uniref:DNA 3'-5' helicase II n=1 Tax=Treponema bryantii TaxID=163 RepID=A0A1I3LW55_9SPIR|nr:UvrD-helicase domain-containing protein [Treponema bryantii]SFI88998.1 UvrD/REP helicase N-terminal domain-containing protein [Treponema bryantii]